MSKPARMAAIATALVVAVSLGGVGTFVAASSSEPAAPAACTEDPGVAVTCVLPFPAPLTVTAPTETVTTTETATVTATATTTVTVSPSATSTPTPSQTPTPTPTEPPVALKVIGMSSPANLWAQRLSEVGAQGVKARRIYADLSASGISQRPLIESAIAAGITPVVSVKFPNITTAGSGGYNAWATTAANQLQAYGVPILIAVWHEPFDDMTGAQWLAIQRQMLPIFNARPNLSTYCILHGWLLDNRVADLSAYMAPDVMAMLDLFGVDSYQSGTNASPGGNDLSTRMPTLLDWLADQGAPDKPLVIGEFSAYTATSLHNIGETILSTPNVEYALLFNSNTGGKGEPLVPSSTRMAEFKAIKADPRAMQ